MADENTPIIIKKIKKGGHGHHGGAWKVAYADFVTAMMAFFLVMWIVGMSQESKEAIQRYFNDPLKFLDGSEALNMGFFDTQDGAQAVSDTKKGGVADTNKAGGLTRMHLLAQDIQAGFKPIKNEVFDLKVFPDKIQFAVSAQSIFSAGSALLRRDAEPLLSRIAEVLKGVDAYYMIEAHTDDLKLDSPEYATNWELSSARAATVVRYFVEAKYFDPSRLTAMGAGQFRPVADNATPEGRAQNRRIDIYVIPMGGDRTSIRSPASEGRPPSK
ncbi:MAG: flagellar motor protein MotB [Bdellovibrionota bacterium]